jgi:transposase
MKKHNNYSLPKNLYGVFSQSLPKAKTRPFSISNNIVFNAYTKRLRTGCQYRELGKNWGKVYKRIKKWEKMGVIDKILQCLLSHLNLLQDDYLILLFDTQSIKNSKYCNFKGYDSNKSISGLKRCPLVGCRGELLDVFVFTADTQERVCLEESLRILKDKKTFENKIVYIYADKGFFGKQYIQRLQAEYDIKLKIMEIDYHDLNKVNRNTKEKWKDLSELAKKVYEEESKRIALENKRKSKIRQFVEHYFAWLQDYRLLNMNYERKIESHRTDVILASIMIMIRRYNFSWA